MPVRQQLALVVSKRGGDLAGVHERERDARAAQLVPQRLAEHALGGLRGPVHGGPGKRAVAGARGHDHDLALGAIQQVGQRGVHGVDGAEPVHRGHALDGGQVHCPERPVGRDTGVGHDEVEPAGGGDEAIDRRGHRSRVGHVAGEHVVAAGQRRGKRVQLIGRPGGQPDRRAPRRQRLREGAPDATRGARDERARPFADLHGRRAYDIRCRSWPTPPSPRRSTSKRCSGCTRRACP